MKGINMKFLVKKFYLILFLVYSNNIFSQSTYLNYSSTSQVSEGLSDIAYCIEALARLKTYWEPGNRRYINKYFDVYKASILTVENKFIKCVGNDSSRSEICLNQLSPQEKAIATAVGAGRAKGNQLASLPYQDTKVKFDIGSLKAICTDGPVSR